MELNSWQIGIAAKTNDLYIKQHQVNRPRQMHNAKGRAGLKCGLDNSMTHQNKSLG